MMMISSLTTMTSPPGYYLSDNDRIYIKVKMENNQNYYLRINEKGLLVADTAFPWIHGSSFQLNTVNNTDNFYIKSLGNYYHNIINLNINLNLILANNKYVSVLSNNSMIGTTPGIAPLDSKETGSLIHISFLNKDNFDSQFTIDEKQIIISRAHFVAASSPGYNPIFTIEKVVPHRGTSLGSWFIPEQWMVPDFYKDIDIYDSQVCGLVRKVGLDEAEVRMQKHLATWVTEEDFDFFAAQGLNALRIPFGYWNIIDDPTGSFVPQKATVSLAYIDWAFEQSHKRGINIVLDYHGLAGSQNGWDHSGCGYQGMNWDKPQNLEISYKVLDIVAERYTKWPNLAGIEIINEPAISVEKDKHQVLKEYYQKAYSIIRKYSDSTVVIFSILWSDFYGVWKDELKEPDYYNVVVDWHLYDWDEDGFDGSDEGHVKKVEIWKLWFSQFQTSYPIMVGEWSVSESMKESKSSQAFLTAQINAFEATWGWFYWNFKIAGDKWRVWSFEDVIQEERLTMMIE